MRVKMILLFEYDQVILTIRGKANFHSGYDCLLNFSKSPETFFIYLCVIVEL